MVGEEFALGYAGGAGGSSREGWLGRGQGSWGKLWGAGGMLLILNKFISISIYSLINLSRLEISHLQLKNVIFL